ncbi:MerR family transcriptional regulator [Chitinilyticum litopenaei]|uniref:MerR family transcriptional regulator n=1 Tax=Chitinilyticum litopenaei TaxID=1121276 RepID=UPI0004082C00|nr:MerR family transcriptional regulator [Chitinilyticum litopenaei]
MMTATDLPLFSIAEVERETGVSKELLRQWERRYAYPQPGRDAAGDRVYSADDVQRLRLLRRLIDHGGRPRKLVGLTLAELESAWAELAGGEALVVAPAIPALLTHLQGSDAGAVRDWLRGALQAQGLVGFLLQTIVPLTQEVGSAWARGELAVHQEHLYTEAVKVVLREQMARLGTPRQHPRMMLTTVPGESHSLGLLMVEAMLRLNGCECASFGVEMPFDEIIGAARRYQIDILVLSFSAACKPMDATVALLGLRQSLPDDVTIWAGGAALSGLTLPVGGIELFQSLTAIEPAVASWRAAHSLAG